MADLRLPEWYQREAVYWLRRLFDRSPELDERFAAIRLGNQTVIDAGFMDGATEFDGHDITYIWLDEATYMPDTHITNYMLRQADLATIRAFEQQQSNKDKANKRADLLLKQVLPPDLWEAYAKSGTFTVGPPKTKQAYTLSRHAKTNVEGRWQYCIAPESDNGFDLPVADRLVAEYLLLVNDEEHYLGVANLSPINQPYGYGGLAGTPVRRANYTIQDIAQACLRLYSQLPGVQPDRRFDFARYVRADDPIEMITFHQQTFTINFHLETGPFDYIERTLAPIVQELANHVTTYLTDHRYRIDRYMTLPAGRGIDSSVTVESGLPQTSLRLAQAYDIQTDRYLFQLATQVIMSDLRS